MARGKVIWLSVLLLSTALGQPLVNPDPQYDPCAPVCPCPCPPCPPCPWPQPYPCDESSDALQIGPCNPEYSLMNYAYSPRQYGLKQNGQLTIRPSQIRFPSSAPIIVRPGQIKLPNPELIWIRPPSVQPLQFPPITVRPPPINLPVPQPILVRPSPVNVPQPAPIVVPIKHSSATKKTDKSRTIRKKAVSRARKKKKNKKRPNPLCSPNRK